MSAGNIESVVRDLVDPEVGKLGLFLEDVSVKRAGKYTTVQVVVDLPSGPGGVDSEQLAQLSRACSEVLDGADPIAGAYTLEVSTPGAERDLTQWRHYSRAEGRLADITLTDGTRLLGRITDVRDESITVVTYEEKNKQQVVSGQQELGFSEIDAARIVVELR